MAQPGESGREGQATAEYSPGTILADRYRIISIAGCGGMGLVYRVEQIFINKILALKTIDRKNISDMAVRRFQHEARAAFAVSHANIVCVHDFGLLDEKTPFLVMDFVEGETLAQVIAHSGCGITPQQAIPIFIQVCFGLAAAHDVGIVHRDLKPSNIIIVKDAPIGVEGSVKVVDFGIAKLTQHEGGEIQALTRTGEIFGSPLYMSPEQCKSGRVDHRSDVYSLGCVLFEALTGASPFIGDNALTTMMLHQSEAAPTLKQASLGNDFPPALETIVAKMLAKDPNDRFQNLGIAAHALAAIYGKSAISLSRQPSSQSIEKRSLAPTTTVPMSKPMLVILLVALSALLFMIGYFCGQRSILIGHSPLINANYAIGSAERESSMRADDIGMLKEANQHIFPHDEDAILIARSRISNPTSNHEINLMGMTLTRQILKLVSEANWITSLKANYSQFDNHDLELLAGKSNLDSFFGSDSEFNNLGATQLSRSSSLTRLEVAGTAVTDEGAIQLARLKHLKSLQISETAIGPQGIAALAKVPSLEFLRLERIDKLTNAALAPLSHSPRLNTLVLTGNRQITDGVIDNIARIPALQWVNLEETSVTGAGIDRLLSKTPRITSVSISKAPNISEEDRARLRKKFRSVTFTKPDLPE